jgi:hypothetical protein
LRPIIYQKSKYQQLAWPDLAGSRPEKCLLTSSKNWGTPSCIAERIINSIFLHTGHRSNHYEYFIRISATGITDKKWRRKNRTLWFIFYRPRETWKLYNKLRCLRRGNFKPKFFGQTESGKVGRSARLCYRAASFVIGFLLGPVFGEQWQLFLSAFTLGKMINSPESCHQKPCINYEHVPLNCRYKSKTSTGWERRVECRHVLFIYMRGRLSVVKGEIRTGTASSFVAVVIVVHTIWATITRTCCRLNIICHYQFAICRFYRRFLPAKQYICRIIKILS